MRPKSYPREFLRITNFELAFTRIVRGGNKEYKQFYRHLFPSYGLALQQNLQALVDQLKTGTYTAKPPTVVYQPKKSGILRPLTLLSLEDLIVYQSIANVVASKFESDQGKYALKKSFGALFAGPSSPFFYKSWRSSYRTYNKAIEAAFKSGNEFVADFDLVSFYDLIDHGLLRKCLARRVKNNDLLDLLIRCLQRWTPELSGHHVNHGVPQGPEPSAFLAECFLFKFDSMRFPMVKYLRYVDDIKLMAKDEIPIRRALLRLDLASKRLGLVPQAQKIDCRRVEALSDILKSVPSGLATGFGSSDEEAPNKQRQSELLKLFWGSLGRKHSERVIDDQTIFKFSLYRLNPRRDVMRQISPFLVKRPDLSWILASYFKRFPKDEEAANFLLDALKKDPTYDASAANYIDAMDVCEPESNHFSYRCVIQTAKNRSEEKSITLAIAVLSFRGKRGSVNDAVKIIKKEPSPLVKGILIQRLFGNPASATFSLGACDELLQALVSHPDPDLARFAAALLLREWPWRDWNPSGKVNDSVVRLLVGLGIRKRSPRRLGVLETFFQDHFGIAMKFPWSRALRGDFRETENRCLRLQSLMTNGDPTARILALDTFNEILLQNYSIRHPTLAAAYRAAAGKNKHPDYGNWLNNGSFVDTLPKSIKWFKQIHNERVTADLAHARDKKTGAVTKPISYKKAEKLIRPATSAWADLIAQWKQFL
jgi:hypothetical protein